MKAKNDFRMTIDSRSINEAFSRSSVAAFAAQLDPTVDEITDIKTAVSEAVTNCIVHAYPDSVEKFTYTLPCMRTTPSKFQSGTGESASLM